MQQQSNVRTVHLRISPYVDYLIRDHMAKSVSNCESFYCNSDCVQRRYNRTGASSTRPRDGEASGTIRGHGRNIQSTGVVARLAVEGCDYPCGADSNRGVVV